MRLTYYSQTLRLLAVEPRLSPRAVAAVERAEWSRGARLPPAVREFYTLAGVAARLARPNWCAGAVPLGEFLRRFRQAAPGMAAPDLPGPRVRFYQDGADPVRVLLDGSDDPPTDSSGPYPETGLNLPAGECLSFSGFVRLAAWSARTNGGYTAFVGIDRWPGGRGQAGLPHLDFLLERYEEWGRTPELDIHNRPAARPGTGARHFCFFAPSARLHLRTAGDPEAGVVPACWWLYGDTEVALLELYAELWPAHGAPVDVHGEDWDSRRPARRRFRKRFPAARLTRR